MSGTERRDFIIGLLKKTKQPITGQELANQTNVSRQVIVTDVALLKTSNEPIIATNQGYLYLQQQSPNHLHRRIIICNHTPDQTKMELDMIVDCGVTVLDVIVEHSIYGELTGSLMINSRADVNQFVTALSNYEATLLSVLTNGIHLHTLEADSMEKIDAACKALAEAGILYTERNK
ncbi:transcription repressor NadR [Pseudogracilibacillus auburnensis]|nr:transcription repressor NadR [Pseudogracilibacillus auburnensis]MBO1004035.1 transcription repressor NadR [Pseudogracilibacillus auburnensis]